ncbi:MAG: transglutaminase-like domain-containing protein [Candidatus Marsarchaeota archaeon]|nr:transglutaminase-like domain-containing protein [Candidatus Marsarchaeota archaeon]
MGLNAKKLAILLVLLLPLLSFGCCSFLTEPSSGSGSSAVSTPSSPAWPAANRPPDVYLRINNKSGPAPFTPPFTYHCFDPDGNLASCEMRIDGRTYTSASNQSGLFPPGYTYPQFYRDAGRQEGVHTIEMFASDSEGLNASMSDTFTVLPSPPLTKPGWYDCTNRSEQPCKAFREAYCDKIVPTDLSVREAAAAAISKHPGAYSVNQLLDIYDYVRTNVPYQNVPVNLTYQPYHPAQTLVTKSGDCKNQAVLIASMVESIGGTARVLLIPDCSHAFAEVYVGNQSTVDAFLQAVYSHYNYNKMHTTWHTSANNTQDWFILDTAGGFYPGDTIPDCVNPDVTEQVFLIYDCNRPRVLKAPEISNVEYGPFLLYNKNVVIDAGYWQYFSYAKDSQYSYCRYNIDFQSMSNQPFSEYIIPASDYESFRNSFTYGGSYRSYDRQEQVQHASFQLNMGSSDEFRVIVYNRGDSAITLKANINSTCYK